MTNEEIEAKAAFLADNLNIKDEGDRDYLLRMVRTLVSLAYEEAAQVADQCASEADDAAERESLPPDHGGDPEIATRIRALKDSLSPETVSSAS